MITGYVRRQALAVSAPVLVADTIDYLTARFVFMTGDWDGLEVWAHFRQGDTAYDFRLDEDGEITADQHLNLTEGVWTVYLTGHLYSGGAMLQRISTQQAEVKVVKSGMVNANPFPPLPATVEEQIFAELTDHEDRLSDIEQNGTGGGGTDITLGITGAVVGQTVKITEVDDDGKPTKWEAVDVETGGTSDAVQFIPQELTDEQQMQARENLGLYRKKEEPILVTQVGPDAPGYLWDITNEMSSLSHAYENALTIEIWDASPEQLREKFYFEQQGSRYSSGSGGDIYLYWYGNLDLIIQNDTAAAEIANKIGPTSEGQYTDVPFVLYTYVDEDNGVNKKWCLFIDSSLTPLHWIGFVVKIFLDETQTVYYPVPEEYIPDSIARQETVEAVDANIPNKATVDGNTLKMQRETTTTDEEGTETTETTNLFEVELPSGGGSGTVTSVNGVLPDANGNVEIDIPESSEGTDIALGISGAAVGQIAKITAVDEAGMPTAWEAVELPDGGGETWEKINEFTLSENALTVLMDADSNGVPFELKKMRVYMYLPQTKNTSGEDVGGGYADYRINGEGSYTYPSADWSNSNFTWTIEVMGEYLTVSCTKGNWNDAAVQNVTWHNAVYKKEAYGGVIKSFLWSVFSPNDDKPSAMAGATFSVWGVRA